MPFSLLSTLDKVMTKFKDLFCFTKSEIDAAFKSAKMCGKIDGFKLLKSSLSETHRHGKLLIITPRAVGKAHKRNLIRRRVKAIFYEEELFKKNQIFILLVYKQAVDLDFGTIKQFLKTVCS